MRVGRDEHYLQLACPHWHVISTDPFIASQWALQNFSLSGGTHAQAGLPHFLVSAINSPLGISCV